LINTLIAPADLPQGRLLSAHELSVRLGVSVRTMRWRCRMGMYKNAFIDEVNNQSGWMIPESSLPDHEKAVLMREQLLHGTADSALNASDEDGFANAPEWSKKQATKYIALLEASENLKGDRLKKFIFDYNAAHPEFKTSYSSLLLARKRYASDGKAGLLSARGWRSGKNEIEDEDFKEFKNLWLREGAPSMRSCWLRVLGKAKLRNPDLDRFPSPAAFLRRVKREIPEQTQYLSRYGHDAWNRKYHSYINRDYSEIRAGAVWVSDHHQLDVCIINPKNGRPCFPWITVWSDFKSGKWLSWLMHCEDPNSDHIFQSFYLAAMRYGLPEEILIDNGKDYRCRDFAGGKKRLTVNVEKISNQICTLMSLHIKVHFAMPYNAQAKTIERSFRSVIDLFCRHQVGYRGGNPTERPEKLTDEIKSGSIMTLEKFDDIFGAFIVSCFNQKQSEGKNCNGKSPDQIWAEEFTIIKRITPGALCLFCMRTTGTVTIGRNGVTVSELGVKYWGEWMMGRMGTKVYARRNIKDFAEAWIFDARNGELIGIGRIGEFCAPALANTALGKSELCAAIAMKNQNKRIAKAYAKTLEAPDPMQQLIYLKAGIQFQNGGRIPEANPKIQTFPDTEMEKIIRKRKELEAQGTWDISDQVPPKEPEEPIFFTETDRELYLRRHRKTA
jgi:putative transposase